MLTKKSWNRKLILRVNTEIPCIFGMCINIVCFFWSHCEHHHKHIWLQNIDPKNIKKGERKLSVRGIFCYWKIKSKLEEEHYKKMFWCVLVYILFICLHFSLFNTFRWYKFVDSQASWIKWSFQYFFLLYL